MRKNLFNCILPSCGCRDLPNKYRLKCLYDVKYFCNKENKSDGHMQCFPNLNKPNIDKINFIEMRVVHVGKKLEIDRDKHLQHKELVKLHQGNWKTVSRCRFIFACYCTYDENASGLKGNLFFTDSHYGEDKIPEDKILMEEIKEKKVKDVEYDGLNYFEKVKKMKEADKSIMYNLQEELVKEGSYYPFIKIGNLTIKRTGTPTLTVYCIVQCISVVRLNMYLIL